MENLTPRQTEILKTIIIEYTLTGEPVGSEILDKKYNLGVSPATVRNEMMELSKKGYFKKEHFSSGRIPTSKAFRYYIKNLMKEKELSTAEEVSCKNDIWDYKDELHKLMQNATKILAQKTNLLAASSTNMGDIHYFGVDNILNQKEFWDIEVSKSIFSQFDEFKFWKEIMAHTKTLENEITYLFGDDDLKIDTPEPCAYVFAEFEGNNVKGMIGVLGPKRMAYETVVPNVRYFTSLIEGIIKEQGL